MLLVECIETTDDEGILDHSGLRRTGREVQHVVMQR